MKDRDQLYLKFYKTDFEQICAKETLMEAFTEVKRNKGVSGIDDVKISSYAENLDKELNQLKQEVENWNYKPQPVKLVEIAKPNGGTRRPGIPTVKDRVLHTAIKIVLEPVIDSSFSESSYGFRPGRSQRMAIEAAQRIVQSGKEYTIDMDLSKFFDRINHDRLISRLKKYTADTRVLRLIGMILRCGVMENGKVKKSRIGTVQGSPLSPLLSNVILDELDKELEKRNLEFCRYADDCNIFVKTEMSAKRVRKSITNFIEKKLDLVVNEDKTKVAKSKYVSFLGVTILTIGLCISTKSMSTAMRKVKLLTPRNTNVPIEKTIGRFNSWYKGWANYYEMTNFPSQMRKIEAHVRRRIRAKLVKEQKRKRFLYRKVIKRGVPIKIATKHIFSNRKTWVLSNTLSINKAWSNKFFIKSGMYIHSDREKPHWEKLKIYPVLT